MASTVFHNIKNTLGLDDFIAFVKKDWSKSYPLVFMFLALAVTINYYFDLEDAYLDSYKNSVLGTFYFFMLNACMYGIPLLLLKDDEHISRAIRNTKFWVYISVSLLVISLIQSTNLASIFMSDWYSQNYFTQKLGNKLNSLATYVLAFVVLGLLIGKLNYKGFGFFNFKIRYKTYLGFLLGMLPLLVFASTQADFLKVYPKLKQIGVSSGRLYPSTVCLRACLSA